MKSKLWTRTVLMAAVAGLTLTVAACGSNSTDAAGTTAAETTSAAAETTAAETTTEAAAAQFGAACSAVPTDSADPGSFEAMAQVPVATAASGNPVLSTLAGAVGTAGLVDTLNGLTDATVFAPSNDAFSALGDALNTVVADVPLLTSILTYHVIGDQRLSPDQLAGTFTTVNGAMLTISGSGEDFTVGDGGAKVVCGNIQTSNATVYILDAVLMPPAA